MLPTAAAAAAAAAAVVVVVVAALYDEGAYLGRPVSSTKLPCNKVFASIVQQKLHVTILLVCVCGVSPAQSSVRAVSPQHGKHARVCVVKDPPSRLPRTAAHSVRAITAALVRACKGHCARPFALQNVFPVRELRNCKSEITPTSFELLVLRLLWQSRGYSACTLFSTQKIDSP